MVQGKHKSVSYRSKKMMLTDESEWTVVEGTHAPIISDEQFAIIHERFAVGPESRREKRMCIRFLGLYRAARAGIA